MAFTYVDGQGFRRFISSGTLRKKLITLSSDPEYLTESPVNQRIENGNEDIQKFLDKLSLDLPVLYYDDVLKFIDQLDISDLEIVKSLFALERVHFLSVIYLLNYKKIGKPELINIVKMPFFTRTEYILNALAKDKVLDVTTDIILDPFFSELDTTYKKKNRSLETVNISDIAYPLDMNMTINSNQYGYFKNSINTDEGKRNFRIDPFSKTTLVNLNNYWIFNESLNETKREYTKLLETKDGDEPTYHLKTFVNYVFNTGLGSITKRTVANKGGTGLGPNSIEFSASVLDIDNIIKDGVANTLNPVGDKPQFYSFFDYVYTAYNNSNNYFESSDSLILPTKLPNEYNGNFNYITESRLKSFLESIFPTVIDGIGRDNEDYFTEFFISKDDVNKTIINTAYLKRKSYEDYYHGNNNSGGVIDNLRNMNFFINKNNGDIVSFGNSSDWCLEDFRIVISNKIEELKTQGLIIPINLDVITTWSEVETYLASLSNVLVPALRSVDMNTYKKNFLKELIVDLFDNYINYLGDTESSTNSTFAKTASVSSKKLYRVITFVQQTFVNIWKFNRSLKSSKVMDLFLLFFYLYYEDIPEGSRIEYVYNYSLANNRSQAITNKLVI